jgi:hypothetical protein
MEHPEVKRSKVSPAVEKEMSVLFTDIGSTGSLQTVTTLAKAMTEAGTPIVVTTMEAIAEGFKKDGKEASLQELQDHYLRVMGLFFLNCLVVENLMYLTH